MKLTSQNSITQHLCIFILLTSILLISACNQPKKTDYPTSAATATPENAGDATDDRANASRSRPASETENISTTVSLPLLQLELPPNWTAMILDPDEALVLPETDRNMVMALSAERTVAGTNSAVPTLLAIQYPRHGLSLEDYLIGVEQSLRERVEIERAGILYDLREDGKPVGIIEYGNGKVGGYQIVQFDAVAENLILLTFTAPSAEIDTYMPEFNQIAAAIAVP